MSEEPREAIAQWLWAMDGIGEWNDWPELHADYLARADAYVADAPWLAALIADREQYARQRAAEAAYATADAYWAAPTLARFPEIRAWLYARADALTDQP